MGKGKVQILSYKKTVCGTNTERRRQGSVEMSTYQVSIPHLLQWFNLTLDVLNLTK